VSDREEEERDRGQRENRDRESREGEWGGRRRDGIVVAVIEAIGGHLPSTGGKVPCVCGYILGDSIRRSSLVIILSIFAFAT
jgi:hypothetical protein